MGSAHEFCGRDVSGRDTVFFERDDIVRTARNARPSIAEGFNHRVAFLAQFLVQLCGG